MDLTCPDRTHLCRLLEEQFFDAFCLRARLARLAICRVAQAKSRQLFPRHPCELRPAAGALF